MGDDQEKKDEKASRAAKRLSKLGASKGGQARGHVLTSDERKEIARKAVESRWKKFYESRGMEYKPTAEVSLEKTRATRKKMQATKDAPEQLPYSMLEGTLAFGDVTFGCHVLNDGRRVITQTEMARALTGTEASNLARYLSRNPLISEDMDRRPAIRFTIPGRSVIANGFLATAMIEIFGKYMEARDEDRLTKSQIPLAIRAGIVVRACAKVGIEALVDEATGFQELRAKNSLRLKIQDFIAEELQDWARMFPDEFWLELARLEGIRYSARNRPLRWGKYVMAFVYDAIDGDVGKALRTINPDPHFKQNHHQWLKQFGRQKVHDQILKVVAIMQTCETFEQFEQRFKKVFQRNYQFGLFDSLEEV